MPREPDTADLVARARRLCAPLTPVPTGVQPLLPRLAGIRAVAFDVYGTLLISGTGDVGVAAPQDHPSALLAALAAAGLNPCSDAAGPRGVELFAQTIALDHEARRRQGVEYPEVEVVSVWSRVLSALLDEVLITSPATSGGAAAMAIEFECRVNPVWPMPGAADVLRWVSGTGRRLAIVSNAQFYTPIVMQATFGAAPAALGFDDDCCAWSYRWLEAKPSTGLYARLLQHLRDVDNISPHQVLYVGNDMRNDIHPAAQLGCATALFAGDQRSLRLRRDEPTIAAVKPTAVVTALTQLRQVLE